MAEFKQMTLSQAAAFDENNGLRKKITRWGQICKDRNANGTSRRLRILRGEGKRGGKLR